MSWLHIARIPGPDGAGAWLVVPGIDDRVFSWAMATVQAPVAIKSLPTFHGWLVPVAAENALWSVIAQTYGTAVVCPECFHGELPCEAWINLVTNRFEAAHTESQKNKALTSRGSEYENNGNSRTASYYDPYNDVTRTRYERRDNFRTSQSYGRGYRSTYDPYEAPTRRKSNDYRPPPAPKPPEPTREERIGSAAKTLGIAWPATKAEIKKAFTRAVLRAHPDVGGSDAAFIQVKQARDLLVGAV